MRSAHVYEATFLNPKIDEEQIADAAKLINEAKKPYILFGQGIVLGNAEDEFKAFVEKSGIPAAWTILGVTALDSNHPQNVGMLGMHGNYSTNILSNECDLIIAVGMRFDDRVTGDLSRYAKQAKVVHLEIDSAEINKIVKADVPVLGDVKETLPLLTNLIKTKDHSEWMARFKELDKIEEEKVIKPEMFLQRKE
jgi:acetolactate synthase-1/2/3 large subunit